jgi:hypothetical protein
MYPGAKENKLLFFLDFLLKRKSAKLAKSG